jgi:6,7-dimethyl-8-ribityllumazine synthase
MPASTHRHKRERTSALPRIAIIVSRYNGSITARLQEGAIGEYLARGGRRGDVELYEAPGAYELPALALGAARTGRFGGVLALGCLIKGDTSHDRYIAEAVANGLVGVTLATGVPVGFGVLTVDTPGQAEDRAGGSKGNKGQESMAAVLQAIASLKAIAAGLPAGPISSIVPPDKANPPGAKHRRRGDRTN